jgi:hypothetical protein
LPLFYAVLLPIVLTPPSLFSSHNVKEQDKRAAAALAIYKSVATFIYPATPESGYDLAIIKILELYI